MDFPNRFLLSGAFRSFRYHGLLCPVRQGSPFHFFHIEMITQGQQMVRQLNVLELSYFSLDGAADISVPVGSSDIAWTYYVLT